MFRPDNRPADVVWKFFDQAFESSEFPSLGWAIGSDWGVGLPYGMSASDYRAAAEKRMVKIYGPRPETQIFQMSDGIMPITVRAKNFEEAKRILADRMNGPKP